MISTSVKASSFTLLLLAVACIVAAYFAYGSYQKLLNSKAFLAQAVLEQDKLKAAESQVNTFLQDYGKFETEQGLANVALPVQDASTAKILAQIDGLAKASGLTLGQLSFREQDASVVVAENGIENLDIEVEASGSYPSLKNFLLLLENNLRLIDLHDISLQVEDDNLIKFKLVLRTYYQK